MRVVHSASSSPRAYVRLRCLYDIGRALADSTTEAGSAGAVVEILARAIPLRSALVVVDDGGVARTLAWRSREAHRFRSAKAHFRDAYAYLDPSEDAAGVVPFRR